jgi:hypothetical protein
VVAAGAAGRGNGVGGVVFQGFLDRVVECCTEALFGRVKVLDRGQEAAGVEERIRLRASLARAPVDGEFDVFRPQLDVALGEGCFLRGEGLRQGLGVRRAVVLDETQRLAELLRDGLDRLVRGLLLRVGAGLPGVLAGVGEVLFQAGDLRRTVVRTALRGALALARAVTCPASAGVVCGCVVARTCRVAVTACSVVAVAAVRVEGRGEQAVAVGVGPAAAVAGAWRTT